MSWLQPSIARGLRAVLAAIAPTALPMPRPTRNTARIMENVYTVAPSISPRRRVQITSAPRAVAPDSAIATYTGPAPEAITGLAAAGLGVSYPGACLATQKLTRATTTLSAAAAKD